jgi:hypothetical protein
MLAKARDLGKEEKLNQNLADNHFVLIGQKVHTVQLHTNETRIGI